MKRIGLIGGTTWISTVEYYSAINRLVNERTSGHDFAECVLFSVNFGDIARNVAVDDQDANLKILQEAMQSLSRAGVDGVAICANALHLFADRLSSEFSLPLVHIGDGIADVAIQSGHTKLGLLGIRYTMEKPFLIDHLAKSGIETIVPDESDREFVHSCLFNEMAKDDYRPETCKEFQRIIDRLAERGAESVALCCTEFPILLRTAQTVVPTIDSGSAHAKAIVDFMLS